MRADHGMESSRRYRWARKRGDQERVFSCRAGASAQGAAVRRHPPPARGLGQGAGAGPALRRSAPELPERGAGGGAAQSARGRPP